MTTKFDSDADFRAALEDLPVSSQRQVRSRFVGHVMELTDSSRVRQAMALIGSSGPALDEGIADAYKMAKAAAIDSYTFCGNEGDWRRQAGHFMAAACLTPGAQSGVAWNAAMNARMARVCKGIADGTGADDNEAKEQYRILESFVTAA